MRVMIVAVGDKPPAWVREGCNEYAKRLPRHLAPALIEVPPGERGKGRDVARAIAAEGERVLSLLPDDAHVIGLDERGKPWTSVFLSRQLGMWQQDGRDVAFLIGGPEGHSPAVLAHVDHLWSLGPLTLPHMLVRLVLVEQLYRAWSLLHNHPYHRA
jgi:23S rRNA (pseudouridine1915-N3)-methyltransferase